jgi:hypothetical protein
MVDFFDHTNPMKDGQHDRPWDFGKSGVIKMKGTLGILGWYVGRSYSSWFIWMLSGEFEHDSKQTLLMNYPLVI